jgi:cytochrome c-type biogenesis protein CcmH/NrfG
MEVSQNVRSWQPRQVYLLAALCLIIGLPIGYLFRGSAGAQPAPPTATAAPAPGMGAPGKMPTLEEMKHMADKQAEPLLAQLKSDPQNAALLVKIGDVYNATHQFNEAADYYNQSLQVDPKNVAVRTRRASCLYYVGDMDQAIAQLQESLKYDPKHAGTLFNLGLIEWRGKGDGASAVKSWQKLLALYPTLPSDLPPRDKIQQLIADAKAHPDGGAQRAN